MSGSKKATNSKSTFKPRKQIRKERRLQKKITRNEHYLKKKKLKNPDIFDNEQVPKLIEPSRLSSQHENTHSDKSLSVSDRQVKQKRKEDRVVKKLVTGMKMQRIKLLQSDNVKEEKIIRSLEKKLKLNQRKTKTVPKSFANDGLDYLLELCGYGQCQNSLNLKKELQGNGNDFTDDIAVVTGTIQEPSKNENRSSKIVLKSDDEDIEAPSDYIDANNVVDSDHGLSDAENERMKYSYDVDDNDDDGVSENSGINDSIKHDSDEGEMEISDETSNLSKTQFREDIYGRLLYKDGTAKNDETKYIPPHLRNQSSTNMSETNEQICRLSKQMKGYLNRLTGSNMHSIASQIEHMYMNNSRHDVNTVLLKLLRDTFLTFVISPERMVIEHAMLISILHANVGSEIGALILQHLVEEFDKLMKQNNPVEDKRIDNVIILLCQLFNFKVFHACLLYDILHKLVDKFQEKEIELILIVLKNVGINLRKDDPVSLKEFIVNVQKKSNESSVMKENCRIRFMLETLTAVKNNNILKIKNYDPTYVNYLKNIHKSLLRQGKSVSELNISLADLLNATSRGRWWIIGSAWSGNIGKRDVNEDSKFPNTLHTFDKKILDLAKKQRMNTDLRKNIFCILMSAEDYIEAFEKLTKLGVKGKQYQEIIHVLIHCLLKEKKHNPFYCYVAEQFCIVDRKYQLAIQFSTWDKFKEIDSLSSAQITNLAKFLSYLFIQQKLPLSVLKVLQFSEMNKPMVRLIRQILLTILLCDQETVVEAVFSRISKSEKLFMLREGLQLFLHHFVLKNIDSTVSGFNDKLELLPVRVELAENAMRASSNF